MKVLCLLLLVLLQVCGMAQQKEDELKSYVKEAWVSFQVPEKDGVKSILAHRDQVAKQVISRDKGANVALLQNGCLALWQVAELCKSGKVESLKASLVKKVLSGVDLTSRNVVKCENLSTVVDNYYGLKLLAEGVPADQAWGGMWFGTSVETVGNDYDYQRYRQVFELNNPDLTLAYMSCLKSVFRYNGYTKGVEDIRPLFDKYMPEGDLKTEINELYGKYYHLRAGAMAPAFCLKDFKGKAHSLEDFKGKVLVVDVWATWCGGCILKLPHFKEMREKYKERDDIEFITISIDRADVYNSWKYTLPRLKLMEMVNLLASEGECMFQQDYNITGIPRYFLIDKEGKIVTVYAPTPGKVFEQLIDRTLNK